MASTGAGYDLGATTFSPDGRIFQVEYATKAVENSGTVVGIRCSDGVVLGVEKVIFSKMLLPSSNRRVATVAPHLGVAQVVARAREEADSYEDTYGIPMPPSVLAQRLGEYVHYFTIHGALRPFGSSTMFAGYDEREKTHQLYVLEPTGVCLRYFGAALGKGRQSAKSEIEKLDLSKLTCREAVREIAKMIYTVYDESKDKPFILEFAWLTEATGWKYKLVPQDLIDEAEAWAKKELEDDDDDDDEEEDAMETS